MRNLSILTKIYEAEGILNNANSNKTSLDNIQSLTLKEK